MKKIIVNFSIIVATLFHTSAFAETPSLEIAITKTKSFIKKQKGKIYTVNLDSKSTPNGLEISCPIGVNCPSNDYTLNYRANGDSTRIRLFLKTTQMDSLKVVENFLHDFNLVSFEIDLQKKLNLSGYRVSVDSVIRDSLEEDQSFSFNSFDGTTLSCEFSDIVKYVKIFRSDDWAKKHCMVMDGPQPKGCAATLKISFPVKINFTLKTELKPIDCTNSGINDLRCGK